MILRLLRLFSAFRALEQDRDATVLELRDALQEASTEKLLLQDRLQASEESVSKLWTMVDDAQKRAYRAMEMQINFAVQQRFGITPYPEATQLPESHGPANPDPVARWQTPSEKIAAARAKFQSEFLEEINTRIKR